MKRRKTDLVPWHRAYEKMQANYTGLWHEITIQEYFDNWVKPEIELLKKKQQVDVRLKNAGVILGK